MSGSVSARSQAANSAAANKNTPASDLYDLPAAFSFDVEITGFPKDSRCSFRDVNGLTVKIDYEKINEGGTNDHIYRFPKRALYNDLVLRRGIIKGSQMINWVNDAVRKFKFRPIDLNIHLVNERRQNVFTWALSRAFPVGVEIAEFKAQDNALAVETLTLSYDHFKRTENSLLKS